MIVYPWNSSLITRCITRSVSLSTLLVASSNINTLLFLSIALAKHNNCCCPCESGWSSSTASRPPRLSSADQIPILVNAETMAESSDVPAGSTLPRTEPETINGSWEMAMSRWRRTSRGIVLMSMPSMVMVPDEISTRRRSVRMRELFPL